MRRRHSLPPEVAAALHLPARDRVLAWAQYDAGVLVASLLGLWDVADGSANVIPWDVVDRVVFDAGCLTIGEAALSGAARVRTYRLGEQDALAEAVRDRVETSIVVNTWHRLSTGGGVRVLARRRHAQTALRWLLAFDAPADAHDAAAVAEAQRYLAVAQESVGPLLAN